MKNVFVFAFLLLGCNIAAAGESGSVIALAGLDGEQSLLTLTELDALPRVQLNATEHGSQSLTQKFLARAPVA